MENTNTQDYQITSGTPEENHSQYVRIRKPKPGYIALGVASVLIFTSLFFAKGLFVAATVNGSPVSRIAVIKELEKQGGKQVLESIIDKKLIETELDKLGARVTQEELDNEIRKIEEQVVAQGGTLEVALAAQGMTREKLVEQIAMQKKIERALADKITVSPEEIDAYIKDSNMTPPEGMTIEGLKKEVGEQIRQRKYQQETQKWVSDLTQSALIKYYVTY